MRKTETNKIRKIKNKFHLEHKKKEVGEAKSEKRMTREIMTKEDIKSALLNQNMKKGISKKEKKMMMIQVQA